VKKILVLLGFCFTMGNSVYGQSPSFQTYINPIIPGDHPDPTLTKIGDHFYTSGSSFNPTPKIYHSTDLVHWEVIAQLPGPNMEMNPVAASGGDIWFHTTEPTGISLEEEAAVCISSQRISRKVRGVIQPR